MLSSLSSGISSCSLSLVQRKRRLEECELMILDTQHVVVVVICFAVPFLSLSHPLCLFSLSPHQYFHSAAAHCSGKEYMADVLYQSPSNRTCACSSPTPASFVIYLALLALLFGWMDRKVGWLVGWLHSSVTR